MFQSKGRRGRGSTAEVEDGTAATEIDVSEIQEDADCCLTDIDDCLSCVDDMDFEEVDVDPEPLRENYYDSLIKWSEATLEEELAWDKGYAAYKTEYLAWSHRNQVDSSCVCG